MQIHLAICAFTAIKLFVHRFHTLNPMSSKMRKVISSSNHKGHSHSADTTSHVQPEIA